MRQVAAIVKSLNLNMLYKKKFFIVLTIILFVLNACNNKTKDAENIAEPATPLINYSVVQTLLHDTSLYTEGLLIHDGKLYESTGSPDGLPQQRSLVGITDLTTGKFENKIELDKTKYFGEGIVFLKGKLFQLTYKTQVGFIYDEKSFKQIGKFNFRNIEGWSLTTNDTDLIMSDGTDTLTFLNPGDQTIIKILKVTENEKPLIHLNELEYIRGFIYANIWMTNYIVKIHPANGKVVGKLDLSSLEFEAKNKNPGSEVLNGIAFDSANDKIYVTGKLWPNIYQIQFTH